MEVTGILFNHDPDDTRGSALNIRRNFTSWVDLPEWQSGMTVHTQSPAAYAIDELDLENVTIFARFSAPEFAGATVEIGADRPDVPELPDASRDFLEWALFSYPALHVYWRYNLTLLWTLLHELNTDVLGTVAPTRITIDASGDSGWVPLKLSNHRLATAGVGRHAIEWHWRVRAPNTLGWRTIQNTRHMIYTLLRTPTEPWRQSPYHPNNTQLPWTDALDYACEWATGARNADQAAAQITRVVYDLGKTLFEYGCQIGAISVYSAEPLFNLTKFLERLSNGFGLGGFVNCSDCATFVSTFANLVGADLWQSQMRDFERSFPVNPIRAIGNQSIDVPCGIGFFSYHEVAWDGEATEADAVYDACLEVDVDMNLLRRTMVLPIQMRFGAAGDSQYRDLLAAPFGRELCRAQPQLRQRRAVF